MELGLDGRTVIVTGGSGGLGRHLVRAFAAEGARVVLTYHRAEDEALSLAAAVDAIPIQFDLGTPTAAPSLVESVLDRTGRIDVLINNAVRWGGDAPERDLTFDQVPDDAWLSTVRDNIEGAIRLTRAVTPHLRARGWGRLVHVSSSIATQGMAGGEYYGAAKAALHGFSRSAAISLGASGDILSNVVLPGLTRTERNGHIVDSAGPGFASQLALGRFLSASELAAPVVFLASAANTGITGQLIPIDAGA